MNLFCKLVGHKYRKDRYKKVRYYKNGAIITRFYRCERCGKLERKILY